MGLTRSKCFSRLNIPNKLSKRDTLNEIVISFAIDDNFFQGKA